MKVKHRETREVIVGGVLCSIAHPEVVIAALYTGEGDTLIGKPVDIWNRDDFVEHYDMEHDEGVTLSLWEFCNQIIHSWVWMLSADGARPIGSMGSTCPQTERARSTSTSFPSTPS